MSEIQALVPLELVLGLEVWLALSIFTSWLSTLANCSLVLLLWWGFDCEWVEEIGLLDIRLVIGLVAEAFSQLGSLSTGMIIGPGTDKTVQPGYIVWDGDLRDDQLLWWIYFECCGVFGR